jgi:hypothetical protein
MHLPKRYGQSSISVCPFCGGQAFSKNEQNVPCCTKHKHLKLPDLKCVCGDWLDQRESKFGVFFTCMKCGAVSFSKMLSVNADRIRDSLLPKKPETKPQQTFAPSAGQQRAMNLRERIQDKIRRGEPLSPDELDFM